MAERSKLTTIIKEFIDEMKKDFLALTGLVAAAGQLVSLTKLFGREMETNMVYLISIALCSLMAYFCLRYFRRRRKQDPHSPRRRLYTVLCLFYLVLSVLSLLPAGYRWIYINTSWVPADEKPAEPEIGKLFFETIVEARPATQRSLEVNMYLDATRTSLQCSKTRTGKTPSDELFNVDRCAEFWISNERMQKLIYGHGIDEDSLARSQFERQYSASMLQPTFDALQAISRYRGRHEPLLDRGPIIVFLFIKDSSWKRKLLSSGLLPNADEWTRLTREYPGAAAGLRRFLVEWVGFLDPFFHVTFRNPTIKQLEITTIKYKANARRGVLKAELSGAYDTPRYLVEMQEGIHEEEIHPPIEIDPSGVKEIDLLLRLKNADPGVTYDIEVEFVTRNPTYRAVLPTFAVTFVDASKFRASGNRPVHTEILNGSASR